MATKVSSSPFALRVCEPSCVGALALYLLRGPEASPTGELALLPDALARDEVVVRETRTVSQLAVDNPGPRTVLGLAGDLVKGGHQDRTLVADILVPPETHDLPLPTFCVERGRWSERQGESATRFRASHTVAPTTLRGHLTLGTHQGQVWDAVERTQHGLGTLHGGAPLRSTRSATSLQLTLEDETLQRELARYRAALLPLLRQHDDVLGHAIAIEGELRHAEWFASRELHARVWPRLLEAHCTEAIAAGPAARHHDAPPAGELEAWLARVLSYGPQPLERSGDALLCRRAGHHGTARETLWRSLDATPLHSVVVPG